MNRMLSGHTVLVTRPAGQAQTLARLIKKEGGIPITLPLIKTVAAEGEWKRQVSALPALSYEWIVFTSANAVRFFRKALEESKTTLHKHARIAAVGRKTAEWLEEMGWRVDLLPTQFYAEELAELLKRNIKPGETVLFPKSHRARNIIPQALKESGARVIEMPLYTSAPATENQQKLQGLIRERTLDLLTFTSPSIVKAFVSFLEKESSGWKEIPVVSIGPITDREAKLQGFSNRHIAEPYTTEGIINGINNFFKKTR